MGEGYEIRGEKAFSRYIRGVGLALLKLDVWASQGIPNGGWLMELRIRLPREEGEDTLVICKQNVDGTPLIAFHGAQEPAQAVKGAIDRITNKTMKWRDDKFEQERQKREGK